MLYNGRMKLIATTGKKKKPAYVPTSNFGETIDTVMFIAISILELALFK
jgi:hypothetical protein